jgi:hypothetical protein
VNRRAAEELAGVSNGRLLAHTAPRNLEVGGVGRGATWLAWEATIAARLDKGLQFVGRVSPEGPGGSLGGYCEMPSTVCLIPLDTAERPHRQANWGTLVFEC